MENRNLLVLSNFKTRAIFISLILSIALALSACGASSPTPVATPTTAASSTPAATNTPELTATPTSLDPCQLVDAQEATAFTGVNFGPGVESTGTNGLKTCNYGAQTSNIFMVEVIQAPDITTAQKAKDEFFATLQADLSQLTSEGITVTNVSNLGDSAVIGEISIPAPTGTINGRAIGVQKGTIFFGLSDIVMGGEAPTNDAFKTEATTILGRLP